MCSLYGCVAGILWSYLFYKPNSPLYALFVIYFSPFFIIYFTFTIKSSEVAVSAGNIFRTDQQFSRIDLVLAEVRDDESNWGQFQHDLEVEIIPITCVTNVKIGHSYLHVLSRLWENIDYWLPAHSNNIQWLERDYSLQLIHYSDSRSVSNYTELANFNFRCNYNYLECGLLLMS